MSEPRPDDQHSIPPEERHLLMPSSCLVDGHPLRQIELEFRKDQAACYLKALREIVAEKSFHYSHVMRVAPSKGVRTRARTVIIKLNEKIALYSRIYSRCRMAMVRLGADDGTLSTFRLLLREDIKASTAVRDPNQRGGSSLRLSWIWHTGLSESDTSPETVHECLANLPCIDHRLTFLQFSVFIGCELVQRKTDGVRNSLCFNMRCNGRYDISCTSQLSGDAGPKMETLSQVRPHMGSGRLPCGYPSQLGPRDNSPK